MIDDEQLRIRFRNKRRYDYELGRADAAQHIGEGRIRLWLSFDMLDTARGSADVIPDIRP